MQTAEIRRRFLAFFEARGHSVVPSASLIPQDPTLLLTNAGMVPFKRYFLGDLPAPYPRAASVQKCVRTIDIDQVGRTTRHASFFQMCGNFSFGDYFKEQAIPFAWRLLTTSRDEGGFGFDPAELWATVYLDDDEAFELWRQFLPAERIQRRGKEDNYWNMGVPGPGGPCSEIYYDRGPEHGDEGGPVADEERYLEVWNLVFMQDALSAVRSKVDFDIAGPLPARNIDTGMGLERMATILQGVDNLYEIDVSRPVLDRAAELTGTRYGADPRADVHLRVVADHVRTAAMLVADGVTPSNEGRGYVLRRLLRRALRSVYLLHGGRLGAPVLPALVDVVRAAMTPIYPELAEPVVESVLVGEEDAFRATLGRGMSLFDAAVRETRDTGGTTLPGERAFVLHDTYGFPYELTRELAEEAGLAVDEAGFQRLMAEQRDRARAERVGRGIGNLDLSVYRPVLERSGPTRFTGYEELAREARAVALLDLQGGGLLPAVGEGGEVGLVLDVSPFYAESGGQEPDWGRIVFDGGEAEVVDVQRPIPELIVHRLRVRSGELRAGSSVGAEVDAGRRAAISRSHTATHMVHKAFRAALGETATQAGSLNAPGRLRFDFHAPGQVPASIVHDVEDEINEVLLRDLPVSWFLTSLDEARRLGALALFGEKYGAEVRVVDVGERDHPYARELCGGTHVQRSAQIGAVTLLSESSVAAGTRRVEGLVGLDAFRYLARERLLLSQVAAAVRATRPDEVPERVAEVVTRLRDAERTLERLRAQAVLAGAASLADAARQVDGVALVAAEAPPGTAPDQVRQLALDVRGRLTDRAAVVALLARPGDGETGRVPVVVATNDGARERGLSAGELVRLAAAEVGGRGGGKPDLAQGGGSDPNGIPRALAAVESAVAAAVRP